MGTEAKALGRWFEWADRTSVYEHDGLTLSLDSIRLFLVDSLAIT